MSGIDPKLLSFTSPNWPNAAQSLLLHACLDSGSTAIDAWRDWQRLVPFDDLDVAAMRLVPILHHNLCRLGVEDVVLGRYRGIMRRSWYANQLLFRRAAELVRQFQSAQIPTLVLKGIPLAHRYYPDTALRSMSDLDVLVPEEQVEHAAALLRAEWAPDRRNRPLKPVPFRISHGWTFRDQSGALLDLHWRVLRHTRAPEAEAPFWAAAEQIEFAGVRTLTLNATDHLLHACVHGVPLNRVPAMRWIVDALMILRHGRIDWERFVAHIEVLRLSVLMNHAVAYLCDHFAAPVPAAVRARLAQIPAARWEFAEYADLAGVQKIPRRRLEYWHEFRRLRTIVPSFAARSPVAAYLIYLKSLWELDSVSAIPLAAVRRIIRRIGHKLRGPKGVRVLRQAEALAE